MSPVRRCVVAVLATAAVVAGCGGSQSSGNDADPIETSTAPATDDAGDAESGAAAPAGSEPGDAPEILRFTSPLVGGGELDAAELSTKPTAFWFWSPT